MFKHEPQHILDLNESIQLMLGKPGDQACDDEKL